MPGMRTILGKLCYLILKQPSELVLPLSVFLQIKKPKHKKAKQFIKTLQPGSEARPQSVRLTEGLLIPHFSVAPPVQ